MTVSVTTTAPILASVRHSGWIYAACLCLSVVPLLLTTRRYRGRLVVLMLLGASLVSCGGGLSGNGGGVGVGLPGTTPGDYEVGITATCSGNTRPLILNLKVT